MTDGRRRGGRRGVVFDLDGVLIDSAAAHERSWRRMAGELGVDWPDGLFGRMFGATNDQVLAELLGRTLGPDRTRELSERKETLYRQLAGAIDLVPGAADAIAAAREIGAAVGLGTSTTASNVRDLDRRLGLRRRFDAIVTADDVERGKPAPDIFLAVARALGVEPGRCLVIEDSPPGLEAARAAGMATIAVASTHPREELAGRADSIVDEVGEVNTRLLESVLGEESRWPPAGADDVREENGAP